MTRVALLLILGLTGASEALLSGQQQSTGQPVAFDVASVKPNKSGDLRVTMAPQPGGGFVATNAPGRGLIRNAYQLQDQQLVGGPSWLDVARFDVVAKAAPNSVVSTGQTRLMLQRLLAERFKLAIHREMRELPIYALVAARSDRKLGPQLHRTTTDCAGADAPLPALDFATGPRNPNATCGFIGPGTQGSAALTFRGVTMETLSRFLAPTVHRTVIDRTGLTGYFDLEMEMTAELGPPPPPPGVADRVDRSSAASIFTALQDQLGLKLEPGKGPVDVVIIDHVEHPTED